MDISAKEAISGRAHDAGWMCKQALPGRTGLVRALLDSNAGQSAPGRVALETASQIKAMLGRAVLKLALQIRACPAAQHWVGCT